MMALKLKDRRTAAKSRGALSTMMAFILRRKLGAFFLGALFALASLSGAEILPMGPGPYAIGSTNLEVSATRDAAMIDYLNGKDRSGGALYLSEILAHPESALVTTIDVPAEPKTFGKQAGTRLPVVLFVLYPTRNDNARADFTFPYKETGDNVFPHMQGAGEKPIFPETGAKYPLVIYSGGFGTHGLWHLEHLKFLASHGFIVIDLFHGDSRCVGFKEAMAVRPLELRAALDFVLQQPAFAEAIDQKRMGASGASAGGHTILSVVGGVDPASSLSNPPDLRIKAAFGLVPYMGGVMGAWPFALKDWRFGEDHAGLKLVRTPFLAVYGQKDKNVPRKGVEEGVGEMSGPAAAVMLDGETHNISKAANSDINTWELLFFNAWLRDDAEAHRQLEAGTSVQGGVHDHKTLQHGPK